MREVLDLIREYITLTQFSPFQQEVTYDPQKQTSSTRPISFHQHSTDIHLKLIERNIVDKGQFWTKVDQSATSFVSQKKEQMKATIFRLVKGYYNSELIKGKVSKQIQETVNNWSANKDSFDWSIDILYLLGILDMTATGDYAPLVFGGAPIGLKKQIEIKPEEDTDDISREGQISETEER